MTKDKQELLTSSGFTYYLNRNAYVNRKQKKILAEEDVEDRTTEWLQKVIADSNDTGGWKFYFMTPPSEKIGLCAVVGG